MALTTGIDGERRVWNGRIDMGVDEFGSHVYGDMNCDGRIEAFDIEPFIVALFFASRYDDQYPDCDRMLADINEDGFVDAFDSEEFIGLLFR